MSPAIRRAAAGLCVASSLMMPLAAQQPAPRGTARLTGTITEVTTGSVIVRASACVEPMGGYKPSEFSRCAAVDSAGRFTVDSIPAGTWSIAAWCTGDNWMKGRRLGAAQMVLRGGSRQTWNVVAPATGCDQRPLERTTGEFTGDYYMSLETSWFFVEGRELVATADFTAAHAAGWPPVIPNSDTTLLSNCSRMALAGTLAGPYEDIGRLLPHYRLTVTRVIRQQVVDSMTCTRHIDRVIPGHSDPPPPTWHVSDQVTAYLVARHRLTGQRPRVVLCGTVLAMVRDDDLERLRDSAVVVAASIGTDPDCVAALRRGTGPTDDVIVTIDELRVHVEDHHGSRIRATSRTRSGVTTRETSLNAREVSVTFAEPEPRERRP